MALPDCNPYVEAAVIVDPVAAISILAVTTSPRPCADDVLERYLADR